MKTASCFLVLLTTFIVTAVHAKQDRTRLPTEAKLTMREPGFRISEVRDGSSYARAGLRNGDVILRVDGCALNSAQEAINLHSRLQKASVLEIERNHEKYVVLEPQKNAKVVALAKHQSPLPDCTKTAAINPNTPGRVFINTAPFTVVYIKGKEVGTTPILGLRLAPGEYSIRLVNNTHKIDKEDKLIIKAGQRTTYARNFH